MILYILYYLPGKGNRERKKKEVERIESKLVKLVHIAKVAGFVTFQVARRLAAGLPKRGD